MQIQHTDIIQRASLSAMLLWSIQFAASAQTTPTEMQNYSRLNLSLNVSQPIDTGHGVTSVSSHNLYGLGISYLYGINVTGHGIPLFLEVGPEFNYLRRADEIDYWDDHTLILHDEIDMQMLTLSTPFNLAYQHHFTEAIVLSPSAGLTAKVNLLATTESEGKTTDLIDMGANRYQLGWNVGCGISFNHVYLGIRYTDDLTSFSSYGRVKESFQNFSTTVGLRF